MDSRINTDIQTIKIIYNRNKHYIIPFVVILISIGLFIKIVIPQFNTFLKVKEEAKIAALRLEKLKKDLSILESINEQNLESQLTTSTNALPINKDFGGILTAFYSAVEISGVNVGRFSFQVGDLDKTEEKEEKFSTINLSATLDNDIKGVNSFVNALAKTIPLSNISILKSDNKASTIEVLFYYKNLPSAIAINESPIEPISKEKISVLDRVEEFAENLLTDQASESAVPFVKSANPFAP